MRFLICISLTICGLAHAAEVGAAERPNIVFILADDLGWTDLGCFGSKYYETPHIDRLAASGMRFTHGYACGPNCQPTRAALLSGQYGPRTGVYTVGHTNRFDTSARPLVPVPNVEKLAPRVVTFAETLHSAGYATGMFGKWHLGEDERHHPLHQGFDEAIVSAGRHFQFRTNPKVHVPDDAYLADFLTDRSLAFMEKHRSRPFLLYVAHFGVHTPYEAKPELIRKFRAKAGVGGHKDAVYAAMIASVDESVGRIIAKLEALHLTEKTLVVFSSDNGGVGGYAAARLAGRDGVTSNAPLRGGKGMLYEGGVRVPFIFAQPHSIPSEVVCAEPIISVDLFPTFIEMAGAKPPRKQASDGVSLVSLLRSGGKQRLSREALYWHFPGYLGFGKNDWRTTPAGAIRSGNYKLIEFFEDNRIELYDLRDDPSQTTNIAAKHPETTRDLHRKLQEWRARVGAKMPARNPAYPQRKTSQRLQPD